MSQALEFFVGTLSIAKCIVIFVVPLLLMYTCHQVHGKHFGSPRGKYCLRADVSYFLCCTRKQRK